MQPSGKDGGKKEQAYHPKEETQKQIESAEEGERRQKKEKREIRTLSISLCRFRL